MNNALEEEVRLTLFQENREEDFQKWKDGLTPTTVAARWKGPTVGPMQEDLIRRLTPGATVTDGYADTTGAS